MSTLKVDKCIFSVLRAFLLERCCQIVVLHQSYAMRTGKWQIYKEVVQLQTYRRVEVDVLANSIQCGSLHWVEKMLQARMYWCRINQIYSPMIFRCSRC